MDNSSDETRRIARILGGLGLIPFAVLAGAVFWPSPDWLDRLLVTYGCIILAFMSGTLWASSLRRDNPQPAGLIISTVLPLAGWPAVVMPLGWAAVWLALGFAVQFLAETRYGAKWEVRWYRHLRILLSAAVISLLVLSAVLYFGTRGG